MAQTHLLALAKQGDPDAIAALMNSTLQARGVTAKVIRIEDYLHVSFSSPRTLNQKTLTEFTRRGLATLELAFLKAVKIYGLKTGEDLPIWTAQLEMSLSKKAALWDTNSAQPVSDRRQTSDRFPFPWVSNAIAQLNRQPWQISLQALQQVPQQLTTYLRANKLTLPWVNPFSNHGRTAIVVASLAFLVGGVVGVTGSRTTQDLKGTPGNSLSTAAVSGDSLASGTTPEQTRSKQQAATKQYLNTMLKAQQAFYKKNNRLAKSLEELERSAAVLSHSYSYKYKLVLRNKTQMLLTAIPTSPGLRSYTAIVHIKVTKTTKQAIKGICETNQPTKAAPGLPKVVGNEIQCPAEATIVL